MDSVRVRFASPLLALSMLLLALAVLVAAASPDSSDTRDRLELVELTHRYAWALDTVDRELLSQVFTHDAEAHYVEVGPKIIDLDVRLEGFDDIWEWLHAGVGHRKGPAGLPYHFMSNHLIELNGDMAQMRYFMHNRPVSGGGVYYVDAVRTKKGWRIARLRLEEQIWKPEAYIGKNKPKIMPGSAAN